MLKEIKKLDQTYYDEIINLSKFAFQYELTEEGRKKRLEEADFHHIWGWITDGELAGKVHTIPLKSYLNGQLFEMGGINAVATWPEYRRQGIIKQLLHHSLKEMKKNGQVLSFLSPFSFSFYRKYGWELAFTNKRYEIPIGNLKQNWQAEGYVRRSEVNISLLQKIYTAYAKNFTGTLSRQGDWWKHRVLSDKDQIAISYNEANDPEGYLIYQVKNNRLAVRDFAYSTLNGWKLLLQFIANHDSMANKVELTVPENDSLALLLENPRFNQKINNYFMARIVDVHSFFEQFPFVQLSEPFESLTIAVEDSFFKENSGVYQLSNRETAIEIEKTDQEQSEIQCSIQMLTMMFLGYKRPLELYQLDLIQGDQRKIEQLESLIPKQQTFLATADSF